MKKYIVFFAFLGLSLSINSYAQECFPTDNAVWVEKIEWINFQGMYDFPEKRVRTSQYGLVADTTIRDTIFSKLYDIGYDTAFIEEHVQNYNFLGNIKQKDQKVWFNDGLLYDFGVSVGDTVLIDIVLSNAGQNYFPTYEFGQQCCIVENIVYENGIKKIGIAN